MRKRDSSLNMLIVAAILALGVGYYVPQTFSSRPAESAKADASAKGDVVKADAITKPKATPSSTTAWAASAPGRVEPSGGEVRIGAQGPGRIDLARTGIGIAVRKGAPRPDVSSPEALRRALLAAQAVGHASPAGGSITAGHIMRMFEKLGIAAEVTPKVKLAAGGPQGRVSVLVSSGEAEIGLQQVSELLSNPEVEVIGMLPAELQLTTTYSAGVTASARQGEAAQALIRALIAPSAAPTWKAKGLDPA